MKRTYGKHGWLFASICFFGLACLGAALDESHMTPANLPRQLSKQDAPPAKVASSTVQSTSSTSRSAPPVIVTTEAPSDAQTTDWLSTNEFDKEMERATKTGFYPARIEGRYEDGITKYRAFLKLKDTSIYSYKCIRNMEGWRYNNEHEYYEKGYQSVATEYSKIIENHQSFSAPEGERHQAVWVVIK